MRVWGGIGRFTRPPCPGPTSRRRQCMRTVSPRNQRGSPPPPAGTGRQRGRNPGAAELQRRIIPLLGLLVAVFAPWRFGGRGNADAAAPAVPPAVYLIERFGTNGVLVHFDTDANRLYELQYRSMTGAAEGGWSNLYVAPLLPWPNHYIIPDTRTNRSRVYRLRVTP